MMFDSYSTFSEENTIACRNNGSNDFRTTGLGKYDQKAYNPEIKVVCQIDSLLLRTVKTSIATKYEIIDNGFLLNRYPNLKTAESFFIDFAGITKGKYNKLKVA